MDSVTGRATGTLVGLIGCGRWGKLILRDLVALGCEVHVVARSPLSIARAVEGGARSVHPDVPAMRRRMPDLEGVVIATAAGQHHSALMEALGAFGPAIPVFCEKPLATSLRDAEEMAAAAPRLFVMDKWRYHPAIQRMASARGSGEFGAIRGLRTVRVQSDNPHPDVSPAWTYLPHDLSIALDVLGGLPSAAWAAADHDDGTVYAFLGGRPWAACEWSTRAPRKSREVTAYFESGSLHMTDPLSSVLRLQPRAGPARDLPVPGEMPLLAEMRAFVAHLRGGVPPRSTAADGVRVVRAVEAILSLAHAS